MALDMAGCLAQRAGARGDGAMTARLGGGSDGVGIDAHGKQEGPHLVMQVASDVGALFFLDGDGLARQPAIVGFQ